MRLSHPEYTKLVFRTYQLLRSTPEFSTNLKQPTPANIRSECLTVYQERPDKKDEPVLRSFFGPAEKNNSFLAPIQNFPTERFKALSNYLKGLANTTDDKNVELLAWLIDFQHRPFRLSMDVILNEKEKAILNDDESSSRAQKKEENDKSQDILGDQPGNKIEIDAISTTDDQLSVVPINQDTDIINTDKQKSSGLTKQDEKENKKKKKWLFLLIALIGAILLLGVYSIFDNGNDCMYWTGDHYERVDCDADVNDKVLFNEERWKNFRKITDLSTITEKSIGVVHYYGNKKREFFTCGGKHPVESTRYLKVMTRYIWEKEFGSKDSVAKDTLIDKNKKRQ